MLTMTTAFVVSVQDIADLRGWADEAADLAGPGDEYVQGRVTACHDALDWIEGVRVTAPVSGEVLPPTRDHLEGESRRAWDAEHERRMVQERGTYPGTVHVTLEHVLGRADAPF